LETRDFYSKQAKFSRAVRGVEEALRASGNAEALLRRLKVQAAALEAARTGGDFFVVRRNLKRARASVAWALWPEPDGYYARAFLTVFDLPVVAEIPEKFFPKNEGTVDGGCVFCGDAEELDTWEFIRQCARIYDVFGPNVVFWAFDGKSGRYVARTLLAVCDLAAAVRHPSARRRMLKQMDKIVSIEDLRALKRLKQAT